MQPVLGLMQSIRNCIFHFLFECSSSDWWASASLFLRRLAYVDSYFKHGWTKLHVAEVTGLEESRSHMHSVLFTQGKTSLFIRHWLDLLCVLNALSSLALLTDVPPCELLASATAFSQKNQKQPETTPADACGQSHWYSCLKKASSPHLTAVFNIRQQ